jgi:hypothetical protein
MTMHVSIVNGESSDRQSSFHSSIHQAFPKVPTFLALLSMFFRPDAQACRHAQGASNEMKRLKRSKRFAETKWQ